MSKKGLSLTGAQQDMVRVCLLRPELSLQEIELLTDFGSTAYQDKSNYEFELSPVVLSALKSSLLQKGVSVSSGEAKMWLGFCAIRATHSFHHGTSEHFAHLYDPIFADIDEALEGHRWFSALIIGSPSWARPTSR